MEEKRSRISAPVWMVDNDDVRQTIRFALATHGMNVRTFPSGEAFLEEVDLDRPGVLVLDLHMKGIGGLEVQENCGAPKAPSPSSSFRARPTCAPSCAPWKTAP